MDMSCEEADTLELIKLDEARTCMGELKLIPSSRSDVELSHH